MAVEAQKNFLSIELVPATCWFSNVRTRVTTDDWDFLRRLTYAAAGRKCAVCGAGPHIRLDAHETWQYDDERHIQSLIGLQALCVNCHRVKHAGLAASKGETELVIAQLRRVNGWDEATASVYLDVCFEQWEKRSQYNWTLDLSFLEPFQINVLPPQSSA